MTKTSEEPSTSANKEISNELNWLIGQDTLTSISAFGSYVLHPNNSQGSSFKQETAILDSRVNTYVINNIRRSFRLSSPKDQQLDWLGGVFLFYDDIMSYNQQQYGPNSTQWYAASGTPAALLNPMLLNGVNYNQSGKEETSPSPAMVRRSITWTRSWRWPSVYATATR